MATTTKLLNLNIAQRGVETNFIELVPTQYLGPTALASAVNAGIAGTTTTPNVNVVLWNLVPQMTTDLQSAIIQFIDKNKSGNLVSIASNLPRTKTITFEFQGSPSNVYQFGNLGFINLILSYPPSAKAQTGFSRVNLTTTNLTA
jgi:hypothetical protein